VTVTAAPAAGGATAARPAGRSSTKVRGRLLCGALTLVLLGVWELLVDTRVLNPDVVAPPSKVLVAAVGLVQVADVRAAFGQLVVLVAISFAIGTTGGILLGSLLGLSDRAYRVFHPYVLVWFATPNMVFLPLLVTVFGFHDELKIVYGAISTLPSVIVTVTAGVRDIDRRLLDAGRSLGVGPVQRLTKVVLPASVPTIFTAVSYGLKHAVLGVLIVELFSSQKGIGYFIHLFTSTFQSPNVYALLLGLALFAILLAALLGRVEHRMSRWRAGGASTVAASRAPRHRRSGPGIRFAQVGVIVVLIGIWQALHSFRIVSRALLPAPLDVLTGLPALLADPETWSAVSVTLVEILVAFAIATVAGLLVGFVAGRSRTIGLAVEPLLVWAQVVPIVILYPACILLFGLGVESKIVFAAVYGFFPIAYSTLRALANVEPRLLDAARALGASRWDLLFKVGIPSARPLILSGLRLGAALTIIGVFAGEILGSLSGVAYSITASAQHFQTADSFGYIAIALAMMAVLQLGITWATGGGAARRRAAVRPSEGAGRQ
jgi:ABC-type nitrate/sulfonate/bicarbonate transport system permease component